MLLRAMHSSDVEFEAALSNSLQHFLSISGLKHEQKLCLKTVAQKHDVFGIQILLNWFREESCAATTESQTCGN